MTEAPKTLRPLPADLRDLLEYHPRWHGRYHFFVDEAHWPKFRGYVEALRVKFGGEVLNFDITGHPVENRLGTRFGSEDVELEARLAKFFGIGEFLDSTSPAPQTDEREESPKLESWQRPRGRPPGPAAQGKIPVSRMTRCGQSIHFEGSFNRGSLRVFVSSEGRRLQRKFVCGETPTGMLVTLVQGRGVLPAHETVQLD